MTIKIIIDPDYGHETLAQRQLRRQEEVRFQRGDFYPPGLPLHATRYPNTCDDCGENYWTIEPWAAHRSCKRPSPKMGF